MGGIKIFVLKVKFEVPVRNPSGEFSWTVRYLNLQFRGKVWAQINIGELLWGLHEIL